MAFFVGCLTFKALVMGARYLLFLVFWLYAALGWSQADIATLGNLPNAVKETSGLLYSNGKLLTHNDSGNAPELYEIDPQSLQISRTVTINNAENTDWEDLAQDDTYLYIADIGNNVGQRKDLGVLRIAKADYQAANAVVAERINFSYPDQTDFSGSQNSDFDAEALFVLGDRLIVLTKQWQSGGTVAYAIPKNPGTYVAERLDSFAINGLVTGASYDPDSQHLFLVGYSRFLSPFFVKVTALSENSIFGGEVTKTNLGINAAQVEAIAYTGAQCYISSEENITPPLVNAAASLFTFTLDQDGEPPVNPPIEPPIKDEIIVFKRFGGDGLNYRLNTQKPISGLGIFNMLGQRVHQLPLEDFSDRPIDISKLSQGLYYLTFFYGDQALAYPFFRD